MDGDHDWWGLLIMQYILIDLNGSPAYQEIYAGVVQRFTDLDGNTVSSTGSSSVTDENPPTPSWAVSDPTPEPEPPPPIRQLTKLEYLRRFTQEERIGIRTAASQSPVLDDYLRLLELAEFINLDDSDTVGAVLMLEGAGLLAAGRAEEILSA